MYIHKMITEDPAEIRTILKFITDFKTRNTRPGYVKFPYRSGMMLAFEYSEQDVTEDEAVATEKYGSISGVLVGKFHEFCEANGFEMKLTYSAERGPLQ